MQSAVMVNSREQDVTDVAGLTSWIADENCVPGWLHRERPLMWKEPRSKLVPAHWSYRRIKPALRTAGRVIGTDLAERRNFILRNPVDWNDFSTTTTLIGAYQSILPGEKARSHRHSPHALRVILDAKGAYSVVDGRRHPMETGDIVLTPGGCWHGHGHDGNEQAYWFDCLDIPLVQLIEPMSTEDHPMGWEADVVNVEHSAMRLEWADTQAKLDERARSESADDTRLFGTTVDLSAETMPTISIKVHRMAAGWRGVAYTHNASSIYVVLKGSGSSHVGDGVFGWSFGDVIAAPMGVRIRHEAREDAVIVELSDERLMRHCRFYRLSAEA